jgi:alanine dehydrogenase
VTIFDISAARLAQLDAQFDGRLKTAFATRDAIAAAVHDADMVVGCVLVTGAAPYTSTFALGASTIPYVHALADKGVDAAFAADPGFAAGLNVKAGKITYPAVAEALGL